MPKDQWASSRRKDAVRRANKPDPYKIRMPRPKRKLGKRARKNRAKAFKPSPVPWVRPAYDDFPAVVATVVYRDYDPLLYGRPAGTSWPRTADEGQKG